jgi:hypothetical protein
MKTGLLMPLLLWLSISQAQTQSCFSTPYQQDLLKNDPALQQRIRQVEEFTKQHTVSTNRVESAVIKIPVVVHILYHYPSEKIDPARVMSQLNVLNTCFRHRNADSVKTPSVFKPFAADCELEFQLAISDPRRHSTSGIIYKYTPIEKWKMDDAMKFSSNTGDDAWDANSYLNIWVCHLDKLAGYASFPGSELSRDGVVLDFSAFGVTSNTGYGLAKTAVHEMGHWFGLKHIWGDENCGDDGVYDTPKQASYTYGCPTTIRITCGNGPYGDMYMNYMDFTSDDCTNMFTFGQKARMRSLFDTGGPRNALLNSKGLTAPLIAESPLPQNDPTWLHPQLYPNPSSSQLNLDLAYDPRWVGKKIQLVNLQGQTIMLVPITTTQMQIDIKKLSAGVYFLAAKKDDGESMLLRFIKL